MVGTVAQMDEVALYAVATRDGARAKAFADKFGVEKAYGSYEYEVLACKRALEQGKLECGEMPHAHTLRVMELLDEIRSRW